ncbi:MAG: aminotransferase class III-fold pyridoxal phosphate-dependent enzyme, partial [Bacteroidales bacterium]|nr:aminotransferase class III-fold pyridoxal phosphate-dependent enzyme [Bacteroidales bacterium]
MLSNKQLFLKHLGQTSQSPLLLEVEKAEGVFMYGPSGEKYLDLISGVSVSNTGHRHPKVVSAIREQLDAYMHLMVYGEMIQSSQVRYAGLLSQYLPPSLSSVYFVNSGSEAVEGAIKLARRFTGRSKIISFRNAYHGSTCGALSIQGSEDYKSAFRPLIPDVWQAEFNNPDSLGIIDSKTACVIIEPVQGEGGIITPAGNFLSLVREKCSETGALLVFDEIQTGFGRTGHMFAVDCYGVVPDIILLAKALGGGMPLGAFISSPGIMSSLISNPALGHITTFGGHPVCCAAGMASMQVIIDEELIKNCRLRSEQFRSGLKHELIHEIRGVGLMLAVKLGSPSLVSYAVRKAPEFGLILDYFLFCDDSFRIAPPLTISDDEVALACRQ